LREVGRINKAVILQRDNRQAQDEWLTAAEHVALGGNHQIVLCECGSDSQLPSLDVGGLAGLRQRTHLPLIVAAPPTLPLARAALISGACGLMLECAGWSEEDARGWRELLAGAAA
jgi:3-deoxy-7-phosphoheptulonate synthase